MIIDNRNVFAKASSRSLDHYSIFVAFSGDTALTSQRFQACPTKIVTLPPLFKFLSLPTCLIKMSCCTVNSHIEHSSPKGALPDLSWPLAPQNDCDSCLAAGTVHPAALGGCGRCAGPGLCGVGQRKLTRTRLFRSSKLVSDWKRTDREGTLLVIRH